MQVAVKLQSLDPLGAVDDAPDRQPIVADSLAARRLRERQHLVWRDGLLHRHAPRHHALAFLNDRFLGHRSEIFPSHALTDARAGEGDALFFEDVLVVVDHHARGADRRGQQFTVVGAGSEQGGQKRVFVLGAEIRVERREEVLRSVRRDDRRVDVEHVWRRTASGQPHLNLLEKLIERQHLELDVDVRALLHVRIGGGFGQTIQSSDDEDVQGGLALGGDDSSHERGRQANADNQSFVHGSPGSRMSEGAVKH